MGGWGEGVPSRWSQARMDENRPGKVVKRPHLRLRRAKTGGGDVADNGSGTKIR